MSSGGLEKDLIVLAADKQMLETIKSLLERAQAFGIRTIKYTALYHPKHDPGCLQNSQEFLKPFQYNHGYALVFFDREGCGRDTELRTNLEQQVEMQLADSGWENRAKAIVIDPELENWVWSDSPEVDRALGWFGRTPSLRDWLDAKGYFKRPNQKPIHPKEAVQEALKEVRKPRSAAIYKDLASKVSFRRCKDPAFKKLVRILNEWFAE